MVKHIPSLKIFLISLICSLDLEIRISLKTCSLVPKPCWKKHDHGVMFSPHKSRKPMTVKNYPMLVLFILCFTFMACLSVWASYSAGLMSKARTTSSKSDRKTDVKAFSRGWNIQRTQFLITEHGSIFRSSIVELLQKGYVFFSSRIICKNKTGTKFQLE